jgi:phage repressor protein C with HTH and peptisase S24 domain
MGPLALTPICEMSSSHLIKEPGFFSKYKVSPDDAFAVYADDDSMAEFIIHGDIVIFDKSKTSPRSGRIFAIDDGKGLRIRQLWLQQDGSWQLECRNADKQRYPDEIISITEQTQYQLCGEFIYRQGG